MSSLNTERSRPVLRLVLVMALWASCFPLIVIGLELAPHLLFAALRAGTAGVVLVVLALALKRPIPKDRASWGQIALLALFATGLGFVGMFHGAEFLSPGLATLIFNTQPLAAAVLARFFLGERLGAGGAFGLALGFSGVALATAPGLLAGGAAATAAGASYVIAAAAGIAVGNVVMKSAAGRIDSLVAVGFSLALGAIPLALVSAATEDWAFAWSPRFVLVLALLSIFGTALAFWLWFEALKITSLSTANSFNFLVPVFAIGLGVWFFGERLSIFELAGALLVLAGVWLAERGAARGKR